VGTKNRGLAQSIARVLGIRCCDIDVLPKHKEWLEQRISDEEHDAMESWCCGIDVQVVGDGRSEVREYYKKGRGRDKEAWIVNRSGCSVFVGFLDPEWMFFIRG